MKEKKSHRIVEAGKGTRFSAENQPKNKRGKGIRKILLEMADNSSLEVDFTLTKSNGKVDKRKVSLSVHNDKTIKQILASLLIEDALSGNAKARKELIGYLSVQDDDGDHDSESREEFLKEMIIQARKDKEKRDSKNQNQ